VKIWIVLIVLLALGANFVAADEYRDFLSADGKAMRGKVLRYDAKKQTVTIQRDNKKTATVPLRAFSENDQAYVLQWEFNKVFRSESSFEIEAKRKKVKDGDESYSGSITAEKVENTVYTITLENKSTSTLEGLELEYCIYYEQEKATRGKTLDEEGVRCGTLEIGAMRPKSSKDVMTEAVSIYTRELDADWIYSSGGDNKISGKVRGLWVRVNMKSESGDVITRDFCMPDSLSNSKTWTTTSANIGRNSSRKKKKKK
jgi:hypothetical protein